MFHVGPDYPGERLVAGYNPLLALKTVRASARNAGYGASVHLPADQSYLEWRLRRAWAPLPLDDEIRADARRTNEGYCIHVHCTGDLGLELAIEVLAKLQWERPRFDHRFTIEHFGLSTPEQIRRLARLGGLVSANVYYVYELTDAYWKHSIGHERAARMARLATQSDCI